MTPTQAIAIGGGAIGVFAIGFVLAPTGSGLLRIAGGAVYVIVAIAVIRWRRER